MMRHWNIRAGAYVAGVAALAALAASPALAQGQAGAARAGAQALDFEPSGVQVGPLRAFPVLRAGIEYNSNVRATNEDEVSDSAFLIAPEVTLRSDWTRHAIELGAGARTLRFFEEDGENITTVNVNANGRLDVGIDTEVNGDVANEWSVQARTDEATPFFAIEPVDFTQSRIGGSVRKTFDRVRVEANARHNSFDYDDVLVDDPNDGVDGLRSDDQDFRDRDAVAFGLRGDYAISPTTAVFLTGDYTVTDFATPELDENGNLPIERDSDDFRIQGGVNFEISRVMNGSVRVGSQSRNFDSEDLADFDGLNTQGVVEWFPSQLTTVTFTGSRAFQDSGIDDVAGLTRTRGAARIDHELRRNVIVSAQLALENANFEDPAPRLDENGNTVQDPAREDDTFEAFFGGTYLLNRGVGIEANATLFDRESTADRANYTTNRYGVNLLVRY